MQFRYIKGRLKQDFRRPLRLFHKPCICHKRPCSGWFGGIEAGEGAVDFSLYRLTIQCC